MESLAARFNQQVFKPYLELLKSQYRFHQSFHHARAIWESKLTADALVHGPYLEKSQTYAVGAPLDSLPLHPKTAATIGQKMNGRSLYKHQTEALRLALSDENIVVATGTSSGKTLCYQIPILDDLVRDPSPGLRAIIIYPLNALVNDQLTEWELLLKNHHEIRFARFSGQTPASQQEYLGRLEDAIKERLADRKLTQTELQREVQRQVQAQVEKDRKEIPNRLNHRDAIRASPPHILITNFSMLEYLLERPIDAPIFESSRLKFLVLDEVHAYRGVQATEIAFLIRRIKDRLNVRKLCGIATSATLGKPGDSESMKKVRSFASELFGESFDERNPIYGFAVEPQLADPAFQPTPDQYIAAAEALRNKGDWRPALGYSRPSDSLGTALTHDKNLYALRKTILTAPKRLEQVAKELWPSVANGADALSALLEVVAGAETDVLGQELLPARLHYFVRSDDGLHLCLNKKCPGRTASGPAYFVTRNHLPDAPAGHCPDCFKASMRSNLVETVGCRKCGYLFGALQDLGPRRARAQEAEVDEPKPCFDSFSTELGWAADSFWSYFSVDDELPYPIQAPAEEDEDDDDDLIRNPVEVDWCLSCGKRKYNDEGDDCICERPLLRRIKIFHRQCPYSKAKDIENLYRQQKRVLSSCPNCGARNGSGLEPVRRFQESDDEVGLAMAIPLAHFQVTPALNGGTRDRRKLLCFTDHRQRAAAFPSLLEEETFAHDLGRKIVALAEKGPPLDFVSLGEKLSDIATPGSGDHDPDFFLPISRFPEIELDSKGKRDLWVAEIFGYFGIPDSAREAAEDLGLVAVEYQLASHEVKAFHQLLGSTLLTEEAASAALQTLLGWMRQRKGFTLPANRVQADAPAFGRVIADVSYSLYRDGRKNTQGWLPKPRNDGGYKDNYITDYLKRLLGKNPAEVLAIANAVWEFLTGRDILIGSRNKDAWKLSHERLFIVKPKARFSCDRCGLITAYSAKACCPRKGCAGALLGTPWDPSRENFVAKWVAGQSEPRFATLKSEEHTAQINKDIAKIIEDSFRDQGVNLLSSTTTFEMGINIGDLQKVLLRNAPPSSANYIQRVGRAGRGSDKNSISVTMCRRTKYDSDVWSNPLRLMSGEVRTPTVFISNRIIAQRHFNAIVFAQFLRQKVIQEKALGNVTQQVRLEAFLPVDSRRGIPEGWFQIRPANLCLDFLGWLKEQEERNIFSGPAALSIVAALSDFAFAKSEAGRIYDRIFQEISAELSALTEERDRLHKQQGGYAVVDIERAIKNALSTSVIDVLARRGFLPRYAFPLDVVTLETGRSRWARDSEVELNRERGMAIAEFAPGAQVIAHKKVFTSAGLYIVGSTDRPTPQWYSKCPSCEQIRTAGTQRELEQPCNVCQRSITAQHIRRFVEPKAFSIQIDPKSDGGERYRRGTLVRQRQTITHFIDAVEESEFKDLGSFRVAMKERGALFRYNLGPRAQGFLLCVACGSSASENGAKADKPHKRLRPVPGSIMCPNQSLWRKLSYGHVFQSFCLIVRPTAAPASVESLAFALQRGLCRTLDIEAYDIGVSWRWLAKKDAAARSEIILYDLTPGGAGFVKEAFNSWDAVISDTNDICQNCTCETACYDCLKNYANQAYHERLQRKSVVAYLAAK